MKFSFDGCHRFADSRSRASVKRVLDEFIQSGRFDFIRTLSDYESKNEMINEIYDYFKDRKNFVQVGIGGSSLGPEMLVSALNDKKHDFHFLNNIDPDKTEEILSSFDLADSVFYVVSKSGGTAETLAQFAVCVQYLRKEYPGIKDEDLKEYFVFATGHDSDLDKLGKALDIKTLYIPTRVGGRFSVLTWVGLLPAKFAGHDIDLLSKSAYDYGCNLRSNDDFYRTASAVLTAYDEGIDQTVLMPYSSRLRDLSFWFVQLWGESLGKELNEDECFSLTPIPAYGATDQHSQMQLFMEGRRDKLLMMVKVKNPDFDFSLDNNFNHPKLDKLKEHSMKDLIDAEFYGTLMALKEKGIPHLAIELDKINEESLGQLIAFFGVLTAVVGLSSDIDPFNQPGVELGKHYAFKFLDAL